MGVLNPEEQERWDAIKYAYVESVRMSGLDSEDQAGQLMRQLSSMRDGLESIRQVISRAIAASGDGAEERMDQRIDSIRHALPLIVPVRRSTPTPQLPWLASTSEVHRSTRRYTTK